MEVREHQLFGYLLVIMSPSQVENQYGFNVDEPETLCLGILRNDIHLFEINDMEFFMLSFTRIERSNSLLSNIDNRNRILMLD